MDRVSAGRKHGARLSRARGACYIGRMAAQLLLVDASSSIFRAFYALPPLRTTRGVPTNAALGFTTMLQKVIREERPAYAAVIWDSDAPRRRKALYPDYKANRDAAPNELRSQFA